MAKLAAKDRKKVQAAEPVKGSFEAFAPGKYVGELLEVETKVSAAGNAYWNIVFGEIHNLDGEKQPGRQWFRLMLPVDKMPVDYAPKKKPNASEAERVESWNTYQSITAGRIKSFFEAFGYSVDSDTDEMIGDKAILQIGVETVQQGANAGNLRNVVNDVLPLGDIDPDFGADADKATDDF